MDKVKLRKEHIWYANATAQNGWSRNVLVHQIESGLYQRQVLADKVTNFEHRLAISAKRTGGADYERPVCL